MMSYALVLSGNLLTSGAAGTNSAAIRGATRADPNLLTVILPQSLAPATRIAPATRKGNAFGGKSC